MAVLLVLTDLCSLYTAIYIALQIRQLPRMIVDLDYNQLFGLLAATLVLMFARKGLYPAVGMNYVDELSQIVSSASFTFPLKTTSYYSRLAFLPASRCLLRRFNLSIPVEQNVAEYVAWMKEQQGTREYLEEAERVMREQGVVRKVEGGD